MSFPIVICCFFGSGVVNNKLDYDCATFGGISSTGRKLMLKAVNVIPLLNRALFEMKK